MAIQDQADGEAIKSDDAAAAAVTLQPASLSRRRFAGLGASGVILTLASQPAMANSVMCTSLSAAGSAVHSRAATALVCNGCLPVYYENAANWTGCGVDPNAMFKSYLSTTGRGAALIPYTLMQVLKGDFAIRSVTGEMTMPATNPDPDEVAKYIIATGLNVLSRRVSFFTLESVVAMYAEYAATSQYRPTAQAKPWSGAELTASLKQRMS